MKEVWKDIPGYEGLYQVSDLGKIKSLNFKRSGRERILNGCLLNTGYLQIKLSKQRISNAFLVHQIVAMAFLNHYPKSSKIVVNHINFNRVDNRLSNLEITTQRKNANRKHLISKSKYTGVSLNRTGKKWVSQVLFNKKVIYLGSFYTEIEASSAYNEALQEIEKGERPKRKLRIYTLSEFNIKLRRGKLGITLVQLSKLSGVSYPTISFIENGKLKPHVKTLVKLDECLSRLEEECRLGDHQNDLTNEI